MFDKYNENPTRVLAMATLRSNEHKGLRADTFSRWPSAQEAALDWASTSMTLRLSLAKTFSIHCNVFGRHIPGLPRKHAGPQGGLTSILANAPCYPSARVDWEPQRTATRQSLPTA
eukprot:95594-Amphidinium_carterae.1